MLTTIKKLFGFKVKDEEDEHVQAISTLDHAKREDHARVLEKARREREERDNRNRERIGSRTSNDDMLTNPMHPLNPLNPINSSTFSESTSKHRRHDTSSDGGSITPHTHGHHGGDGDSGGGGSDGGGGDGGGGGGD